uniref:SCP domain-containing protein n=1 Tax=Mesocestoides corti TaxID=53468 RepID=A0A5K3F9E6_MESCO
MLKIIIALVLVGCVIAEVPSQPERDEILANLTALRRDVKPQASNMHLLAVWATSTEVGCAKQFCKEKNLGIVACAFNNADNSQSGRPYIFAPTCSQCPDGYACLHKQCTPQPGSEPTTADSTTLPTSSSVTTTTFSTTPVSATPASTSPASTIPASTTATTTSSSIPASTTTASEILPSTSTSTTESIDRSSSTPQSHTASSVVDSSTIVQSGPTTSDSTMLLALTSTHVAMLTILSFA